MFFVKIETNFFNTEMRICEFLKFLITVNFSIGLDIDQGSCSIDNCASGPILHDYQYLLEVKFKTDLWEIISN